MEKMIQSKKKLGSLFLIMSSFIVLNVSGQARETSTERQPLTPTKKSSKFDPSKLVVGGGLGAQFGSITSVQLAPMVGYLFTENLLLGVSGKYIYYEEDYGTFNYSTNMYGGGVFGQYYFFENFITHLEYELLNLDAYDPLDGSVDRINVSSFFIGGGYRSTLGGNSFASIMVLYNINDDIYSPYINPLLRVSFGIGL